MVKTEFSVLSFNAGLFMFRVMNLFKIEVSSHIKERLEKLPPCLISLNSDIVCLQEIYEPDHVKFLISKMKEVYPYFSLAENSSFGLSSGLLIFSKFPILKSKFYQFDHPNFFTGLFAKKGFQRVLIRINKKNLNIINSHTWPPFSLNPPKEKTSKATRPQIEKLLAKSGEFKNLVIAGDFNIGPEVYEEDYELFLHKGFSDVFEDSKKYSNVTWNPKIWLNNKGIYNFWPPERVDHIFFRKGEINLLSRKIVFKKEVLSFGKKHVTLSDHYGVYSKFRIV